MHVQKVPDKYRVLSEVPCPPESPQSLSMCPYRDGSGLSSPTRLGAGLCLMPLCIAHSTYHKAWHVFVELMSECAINTSQLRVMDRERWHYQPDVDYA